MRTRSPARIWEGGIRRPAGAGGPLTPIPCGPEGAGLTSCGGTRLTGIHRSQHVCGPEFIRPQRSFVALNFFLSPLFALTSADDAVATLFFIRKDGDVVRCKGFTWDGSLKGAWGSSSEDFSLCFLRLWILQRVHLCTCGTTVCLSDPFPCKWGALQGS